MTKRFALISVYNKKGILELAKIFKEVGVSIIATSGTGKYLKEEGLTSIPVEKITGNPESFDGRVKTISFHLLSGILFDRENKNHKEDTEKLSIPQIDFVVCNFYPFWEKPSTEMIDIGGPTMVRAAAKNYTQVTVLVDPADYMNVQEELQTSSETSKETRRKLAGKAFKYVVEYNAHIQNFFTSGEEDGNLTYITLMDKGRKLRYGENPHQKGYVFQDPESKDPLGLGKFNILQGKDPSYNNYLDVGSGIELMSLIGKKDPACVIIKHTNACGAAVGSSLEAVFEKAWFDGDPLASFGGVIIFNRHVDEKLAQKMLADKKFFEIVAAPSFDKNAITQFSQKQKLQLWENSHLEKPHLLPYEDVKKIRGGFLVQDGDTYEISEKDFRVVTKKSPTKKEIEDLIFAAQIAQVSKSNAVVAASDRTLLSSGVGQQDRKRCCELCVNKAVKSLKGAVAATDGFFPFRDGPDILIKAGIAAIAQPGGSIRDQEVIDACDEQGVAMVFTDIRGFRH